MKKQGPKHKRLIREGIAKYHLKNKCALAFWNFNHFGKWIGDYKINDLDVKYSLDAIIIRHRINSP